MSEIMYVRDTRLPVCAKSIQRARGDCAALLDSESECTLQIGHLAGDLPHKTQGLWTGHAVFYNDTGRVISDDRQRA